MKRLERSNYGMIGGVCRGLSNYFNIDPVITRVIATILLCSGVGLIPYIILWVVMPLGID